jgi:hypothetical protein
MTKFLKLTRLIINTKYIHSIVIHPNKYCINVASNKFEGSKWNVIGFGFGNISSYNCEIEVCETQNPNDYNIVSDWICNH